MYVNFDDIGARCAMTQITFICLDPRLRLLFVLENLQQSERGIQPAFQGKGRVGRGRLDVVLA